MRLELSELPPHVWISRLWAQYNVLPEHLKKGFVSLVQNMAKNAEQDKSGNSQYNGNGEKTSGSTNY